MHRSTTTTAALLVSVAVSATASGCVSVERSPRPATAPTTASPSAPRTDGRSRPQIEQAPARDALVSMGPPRRPAPQNPAPVTRPSTPAPRSEQPQPKPKPPPVRRPPAARPDARATRPVPPLPPPTTDVCALGEAYGGWRPGSPESVICRDMYGR
ncbi:MULTISPECIES: hypothetical protein [Streptomyces]|uniref:hypothetical protein n=1 Tax=Streptomyces TaxID=1883 RepID=UPI001E3F6892|nr:MULTISPECIES: hypothetical protein [Streptomyces]UFQ14370.1 hypothetical protein J2N69_04680 [Streptomyces huasconensis]WCL83970.1 hypothetical protein PPN52_04670 [Streptomyces sp. JCM 35825]